MSNTEYVARLRSFYKESGLLVGDFRCAHADACAQAAGFALTQGAEAHVGTRYGDALRVVVVSLDTGGTSHDMAQRREVIEGLHPSGGNNPHMKGTTELLKVIFETTSANGVAGNVYEFYAMTNAAKCSRRDSTAKVPGPLYSNCMKWVEPELVRFAPQLIVTQGNEAYWSINSPRLADKHRDKLDAWMKELPKFVCEWLGALADEYLATASFWGKDVPIIKTVHPSARGGQWQRFAKTNLRPVVRMATVLAACVPP